jgi:flagellar M-ring protein FliF
MSFTMTKDETLNQVNRRQIILIAGAAFAGAALLFMLWYLFVRVSFAPAFTGLKSTEAAAIVGELERVKTPYRLTDGGATILVPADAIDVTRVSILSSDLPLRGAVGFELFNKTDMGLSEFAQKINYQRALQGELARTIMALDKVDAARVHLSLPESGIFQRDRQVAKASITIATKAGATVDADVVSGIQQLVASAVPDLAVANVAVLDARGRLLNAVSPPALAPQDEHRTALEQVYVGKIRSAINASGLAMPMIIDVISFENFASVSNGDDLGEGGLTQSSTRKGPLKVSIELTAEPGPSVRERLLAAARQAIRFDASLGDVISIDINASRNTASPARIPTQAPVAAAQPLSMPDSSVAAFSFWPVLAGLMLVFLSLVGWRWSSRGNRWSPNERDAFAARLKVLLEEDARDAQPSR